MRKVLSFLSLLSISGVALSEDIELYIGDALQNKAVRPQVLIIFDTSGSMSTDEEVIVNYKSSDTNFTSDGYLYYSTDSTVPEKGDYRRFPISENNCGSSLSSLNSIGYYTDKLLRYNAKKKKWSNIGGNPDSYKNWVYIDCQQDVISENKTNAPGVIAGLPSNDVADLAAAPPYADTPILTPDFVKARTIFTSHYVDWYHNAASGTKTRLEIAKDTVTDLIESAPGVSFGLEVFNRNSETSDSGGRISYGIKDESTYDSAALVKIIDDKIYANGWTPLCESLYEAALYFGGKTLKYGNSGGTREPLKDNSVTVGSKYKTPYSGCSNQVYVILMTDGVPVRDTNADANVDSLISGGTGNRLDELAKWMHDEDINPDIPGRQFVTTFTIGFGEDAVNDAGVLLAETAKNGGGKYYPASNPGDLLNSLQSALLEILNVNTSFTAPSVASNNFDRTETLESVYYAMFLPERGASWNGNLKKLKVVNNEQVDRNNESAVDSDGIIKENAKTFWSTSATPDGNDVKKGGVAEMLTKKTSRKIYSDIAVSGGGLELFTKDNAETFYETKAKLANELGVVVDDVYNHIDWARGLNVDGVKLEDGTVPTMRPDVFGDPLHSKPLVINYGGTASDQDVRIIVGTNAGALHMFDDNGSTVDESWAFMPSEFFSNIATLKEDLDTSSKVYGIDGPATSYLYDHNGDGSISGTDDKAWVFFGLRRGGNSYYALDVSTPDAPKLLWKISATSSGPLKHLGQTWSKPKVGYSILNVEGGAAKPVLIFGGGYSESKDALGVGGNDDIGKGIFMVDAETGTILWSLTPEATSSTNTKFTGFTDSIPSSIATLDSDADGLIDRLYTGDTGGNVWRIDMPGSDPFSSTSPWTIFKIASLGGATHALDRRFFSEPSIVRTFFTDATRVEEVDESGQGTGVFKIVKQERPYEAILIGSGDRSTPKSVDTDDQFFMIKDGGVKTESYLVGATAPAAIIPNAVVASELHNFTNNPFGDYVAPLSSSQKANFNELSAVVSSKPGWYVDYNGGGEKSTSSALAINGVAYFTSFTPAPTSGNTTSCVLSDGFGTLYAIDLEYGTTIHDWRAWNISAGIPDTPAIIITKDPELNPPTDPPEGSPPNPPGQDEASIKLLAGKIIPLDISLKTSRSYLYVTEEQ